MGCYAADPLPGTLYVENINYTGDVWEEISVPANEVGEGWPAPPAANIQSGYTYLFADYALAVDEVFVHFNVVMPHSWKEGTNVIPNVRFVYNSDQVGTSVRWRVSYSWANIGSNFPVSSNMWAVSTPANNDSLKHQKTDFAEINGAGKTIGSMLLCYLSRNSSDVLDTYTDTALFVSVGLLYRVDAPGSINKWSK